MNASRGYEDRTGQLSAWPEGKGAPPWEESWRASDKVIWLDPNTEWRVRTLLWVEGSLTCYAYVLFRIES